MVEEVLISLTVVVGIAALLSIIARLIKQPPIISYLIAGVIAGPLALNLITYSGSDDLFQVFSHIGVAFLLFIVGLSLDIRVLKEVGGVSALGGLAEISLTGTIGFILSLAIGFPLTTSIYIAAILAFSSTVVVVKILSDKKEIDTLHGRIALGILIVEDFVAAIALMLVPMLTKGTGYLTLIKMLGLAVILTGTIFILTKFVMKKFLDYLARHHETLFLFSIGWALAIASLFNSIGFSLEIGALIAGMSLASSKYHLELGGKIKPLRDFFVVLFFVFFGSQLSTEITFEIIFAVAILSLFVIIGKPIIVMSILRLFGYKKRTNFLAGSSLAQISEFSLILALLGFNLGIISKEIISLSVLIAIITIGISSYSIFYSHRIFNRISHHLWMFEGKKENKNLKNEEIYEVLLFGYHRIGYKILQELKKLNKSFAVVDINPKVILSLSKDRINSIYGDAGDRNFLSELPLKKAKLIISTIPEESINLSIKEFLKEIESEAVFIATAEQPRMALDLYEEGADFVIIPHHLGGDYASQMIRKFGTNKQKYREFGKKHMKELLKGKRNSNFN